MSYYTIFVKFCQFFSHQITLKLSKRYYHAKHLLSDIQNNAEIFGELLPNNTIHIFSEFVSNNIETSRVTTIHYCKIILSKVFPHFFITLQFNYIYFVCVCGGGGVRFPLLLFGSSVFWVRHSRSSSMSLLY